MGSSWRGWCQQKGFSAVRWPVCWWDNIWMSCALLSSNRPQMRLSARLPQTDMINARRGCPTSVWDSIVCAGSGGGKESEQLKREHRWRASHYSNAFSAEPKRAVYITLILSRRKGTNTASLNDQNENGQWEPIKPSALICSLQSEWETGWRTFMSTAVKNTVSWAYKKHGCLISLEGSYFC